MRFVTLLREKYEYPADHLFVLAEKTDSATRAATSDQVRVAMDEVRRRAVKGDLLLVLLVGHGTVFEGDDAKFNLVGPDLDAEQWAGLLDKMAARVVFVNATAGSSPFLRKLAARDRIVVTATDTIAQRFATIFPEFFIGAFDDEGADLDKDARVSIWEAFEFASAGVRRWFDDQGRPSTERALLDDTGAGMGREAGAPGADGVLARRTYLQAEVVPAAADDPELARLFERRDTLEAEIDVLTGRRATMTPQAFEASLERLLLDLAEINREIRQRR
jgi:hypothetical protein